MASRKPKGWLRYPRTTQEIRANQNKHDVMIRGKRRLLPNCRDDIRVFDKDRNWKKRRKTQYRTDNENYAWHEFWYDFWDVQERINGSNLIDFLISRDFYHKKEYSFYDYENRRRMYCIRWFGEWP